MDRLVPRAGPDRAIEQGRRKTLFEFGINNAGDVVGTYRINGHVHGFVRSGGVITTVVFPDMPHTYAIGIDDASAIVG